MDLKTLFGLTVIPAGFLGGILSACLIKPLRDLYFVLLVCCSPLVERLDLNYVSREWYRGTSRGFEVAVLDILAISLLVSTVLVPRRGQIRAFWPASYGLMILMFLYAAFNVAISDPKLFGLFELFRMFRGLLLVLAVAFYVRSERELRLYILGMVLLVGFQAFLAIKQRYIDGLHRVPGTLIESNSLSVLLCTTTPVLVAGFNSRIPTWLKVICVGVIPAACAAEILTISRAGIITLGIVLLGTLLFTARIRLSPRTFLVAGLVFIGAGGMLAKAWKTLGERFKESNFQSEYENKRNLGRGYYLRIAGAIVSEKFFGVGLNNWSYWASNRYGPKLGYRFVPYKGTERAPSDHVPSDSNVDEAQAAPAHSLGALTMGELGYPGFVLFSLLWLRWFQMGGSFLRPKVPDPMRRLAIGLFFGSLGLFLQNLTEWVFRHLPIYYTFHIMLGVLMSLYYIKRQEKRAARQQAAWPEEEHEPASEDFEQPTPEASQNLKPESGTAYFSSYLSAWKAVWEGAYAAVRRLSYNVFNLRSLHPPACGPSS